MAKSKIEWTESTWNPVTGCTKISSGCANCYAEVMARRLQAMGQSKYKDGFKLTLHPDNLNDPYSWKKSRMIFVNSMSDLFHEEVPIEFIQKVFKVILENPQHTFQVLTKRSELLLEYDKKGLLNWPSNLWMGVTVESDEVMDRINDLSETGAAVKFLSCEPLLSPLGNMILKDINWVIVGGESGRNPREMKTEWVMDIKSQCRDAGIPFYFKQWGGVNKKKSGRELFGKKYDEMPVAI